MRTFTTMTMMLALALTGLLVGCQNQVAEQNWTSTQAGDRTVTFRELEGELGGHALAIRQIPGASWRGDGTELAFDATHREGYASFRITSAVDLFAPGMGNTLLREDVIRVHGVTGSDSWDIDYDGYADEVEMEVFEGAQDNTRRVDLSARFGGEEVRASVVLDLVAPDADDSWNVQPDPWDQPYQPAVNGEVLWDSVTTDLGPGADRNLTNIEGSFEDYGDGSRYLRIDTTVGGSWTMFALSYTESENGDVQNPDVLGCVGPTPGNYDYDGHADNIDIQIRAGANPGERIGTIDATFNDYSTGGPGYLHATFRYTAR